MQHNKWPCSPHRVERLSRGHRLHVDAIVYALACHSIRMRTTVELDADTAKEVERLRREHGRGVSQAVNELIRRGLARATEPEPFKPRTREMGLHLDVSNVADALDFLEGPEAR